MSQNYKGNKSGIIELLDSSEEDVEVIESSLSPKKQIRLSTSTVQKEERNASQASNETPHIKDPSPKQLRRCRTPSTKALENWAIDSDDGEKGGKILLRRSVRKTTPSKHYLSSEYVFERTKKRQTRNSALLRQDNESTDSTDSDSSSGMQPTELNVLQPGENDWSEKRIFGFKTPKKRDGMANLATAAINTPSTSRSSGFPKTPKSSSKLLQPTKTPHSLRRNLKRAISRKKSVHISSDDDDFSPDDSDDYKPNNKSSTSDSSTDGSESNSSQSDGSDGNRNKNVTDKKSKSSPEVEPSQRKSRMGKNEPQEEFILQSEGFFAHHTNKKITTSNHTLDRLKNPRLPQDELFRLLGDMEISKSHQQCIRELCNSHKRHFQKWLFLLDEGFSILLYGLGSKRRILEMFHDDHLSDEIVIVVNGFFPALTISDILNCIANATETKETTNKPHEFIGELEGILKEKPDYFRIFLLVHNLDGIALSNAQSQAILGRLVKLHKIYLIASIDHINGQLLWDHTILRNFNFSWFNVTTMLPYIEETAFENSLLVNNSGQLALSSMKNVYESLTQNTRKIYLIVVGKQLDNKDTPNYPGLPFKDLYSLCRNSFLVSSDLALRAQLTEFIDHNLVKMKRAMDGAEYLTIPIENSLLQQFLDENKC